MPNDVSTASAGVPRPGSWPLAALVVATGYALLRLLGPRGEAGSILGHLAFLPLSAGTTVACLAAARRAGSPLNRLALRCYAASFGCTALGTTLTVVGRAIAGTGNPLEAWANVPFLLSYPLAIAALRIFPISRPDGSRRLRELLETAIALAAAVTLTWFVVVRRLPVPAAPAAQALLLAYPAGDLVVFAALVPLLLSIRARRDAFILRILGWSQLSYIMGDLTFLLLTNRTSPVILAATDVLYVAGYSGMLWALQTASRHPEAVVPRARAALEPEARNPLPFGLGLVMYGLLIAAVFRDGTTELRVLSLAAVGVSLLILWRESLTEQRNVRLARELEATRNAARLRGVVSYLRTGVVVVDSRGDVILTNGAARRLLGLVDNQDGSVTPPTSWDVVTEAGLPGEEPLHTARRALESGLPVRGALIGVAMPPAGTRTWFLVDAEPLAGPDGRAEEVVCTFSDITERRAVDEQLRQAQRLEAVGQLAGGVAHDFNNLLTAITGYGGILMKRLQPASPLRDDVQEILHAAERASSLTRQLLAYGRRQVLHPDLVDLNTVVRESERLLRQLVGARADFQLRLAPDLPPVLVDRGQVEQVLVNLAVNARDAMPGGGTLTLSTRLVSSGAIGLPPRLRESAVGSVLLTVHDSGTGMTDDVKARAFEPFFTTKPVGQGTGLGLSTVYGIVRQSRGDAWIESEAGCGTAVHVLLPTQPAPRAPGT